MTSYLPNSLTPAFLAWALEMPCAFRLGCAGADLQRLERQLRPLRAAAEALAEQRCIEGVCFEAAASPANLEQVLAFDLRETLQLYDGQEAVQATCENCPANVAQSPRATPRWAGCYGELLLPAEVECYEHEVKALVAEQEGLPGEPPFRATSPRWYGLWSESPLSPAQLAWLTPLADRFAAMLPDEERLGWEALHRAMAAACEHRLALHVKLHPPAEVHGRDWIVPAHCFRCAALRPEPKRPCPVCGEHRAPAPQRKRKLRGRRPYWPLVSFRSREEAERLWSAYRAGK